MRTVNTYIARNMLVTTAMALGILSFVLVSGHFYHAFELVSRGVPLLKLLQVIALLLPDVLIIALPLALLVSTVLVFSRMSADSEIIALKSMGISIWQTVMPAIAISFMFSIVCLWMALWVSPACRYKSELLKYEALVETPLTLLEPGEFSNAFPRCSLRVGSRTGKDLKDIHIISGDEKSGRYQDITAETGTLGINMEKECLELNLRKVSITDFDLGSKPEPDDTRYLAAETISLPLSIADRRHRSWTVVRRNKYLNLKDLCAKVYQQRLMGKDVTSIVLDLHSRVAMALSPFAFLLLGLPFGIRSRRSELSVGLLICVLLALVYYAFVLLSNALRKVSGMHPELIIWIPNITYQIVGLIMLKRLERQGWIWHLIFQKYVTFP